MGAISVGFEKGYVEQGMGEHELDEVYVIHPRKILNEVVLKSIFNEFVEQGFTIYEQSVNGKIEFVAEKKHKSALWVKPTDDLPDVNDDVEIITNEGYQRKSVYVVDKYGNQFFVDEAEICTPISDIIVWRKL